MFHYLLINHELQKQALNLCPVLFFFHRRHTKAADRLADGHLPKRKEGGHEQQAGHRQHGWSLLHAARRHGPEPAGFCLGTSALLEASTLSSQVRPTGLPPGYQQGKHVYEI